jgi:hypothetical protein
MSKINDPRPRSPLPRRLYTVDQYADVTEQCRASVYNGMRAGLIPFIVEGGRRKIPVEFVDNLLKIPASK